MASANINHSSSLSPRAICYMALLALQFGFQPILTKRFTSPLVNKSSVVIVQEIIKFFMALSMLLIGGKFQTALEGWSVGGWIQVAMVPAALYSVQNVAALTAYENLEPVTYNVLNQTKTLSAALCCYILIGRKQSMMQIVSLFMLLLSALVIERVIHLEQLSSMLFQDSDNYINRDNTSSSSSSTELSMKHWTHGVLPILLASFISGLAGAITQKNLQSSTGCGASGGRNSFLFSMELCVASILMLSMNWWFSSHSTNTSNLSSSDHGTFFEHWSMETLIPILTNASGGLLVGLVTKYAGSVRKGFALIFGILLSGIAQAILESHHDNDIKSMAISKEEIVGGIIAAISLWTHATHPYKPPKNSMKTIVVPASQITKQKRKPTKKEN